MIPPAGDLIIFRFHDIRDAVTFSDEINACCEHEALFEDDFIIARLVKMGWQENTSRIGQVSQANYGTVAISFFPKNVTKDHIANLMEEFIEECRSFGSVLAASNGWRSIPDTAKTVLYVEFHDCQAAERLMGKFKDGKYLYYGIPVSVAFCCLHSADKLFLFHHAGQMDGTCSVDGPPTPTSLSSEAKIIRPPFRKHSRSLSTLSSTFSNLSITNDAEDPVDHFRQDDRDVDFYLIETGQDRRTTCMIKNIPNKYTQQMLIDHLDESHAGRYDFVYLRMDFKNKCNVGYAFINFLSPMDIMSFAKRMVGRRWPKFNSEKRCEIAYARIQGKEALMEKFRNSRVMQEPPSYRPRVFNRQ